MLCCFIYRAQVDQIQHNSYGHQNFQNVNEHWLQLQVTSVLAPNKKVSLFFENLKPDIDVSLAMKAVHGIFCQHKTVLFKNLLLSVAAFINYLSQTFWITWCSFYISTCCFILYFLCYGDSFFASFSFHRIEDLGPCSGLGFGLRECCGWFDLLSRPLKLSS